MKKGRFSEEQIVAILNEANQGKSVADICRDHKVSSYTFYKWRKKFRGMSVDDAKRLKQLEQENARLKALVADQSLNILVLKDALGKK
ncbi:MAG: transposase [Bacteriovoracia bacterium]